MKCSGFDGIMIMMRVPTSGDGSAIPLMGMRNAELVKS